MNLSILSRHDTVGSALWLYEYLREHTTPVDAKWMPVGDGLWITDTQLAYMIDVAEATIRRWRKKLERLGYVHTELVRPRYRKFWLANPNPPVRQQARLIAPVSGMVN